METMFYHVKIKEKYFHAASKSIAFTFNESLKNKKEKGDSTNETLIRLDSKASLHHL